MATSKAVSFETEPVVPMQDDSEVNPKRRVQPEEVILKSSQIDANGDSGGDPYNSTGQYVILEVKRAEKANKEK